MLQLLQQPVLNNISFGTKLDDILERLFVQKK